MSAHKRLAVYLTVLITVFTLVGCVQTTPRLVKIGLVAPFEGRYREIGVDVIPAARLAIREWAAQHPDSDIAIELVAYDDAGTVDQAVTQAHKLTADPDVAAVIGHWRDDTTAAALPVYEDANLPLIAFSSTDLVSDSPIYNLSPTYAAIRDAVTQWSGTQVYVDAPQSSVISAAGEMTSNTNLIGDETWGLSQFYHLAPELAEERYFASGFAMVNDLTDPLPNRQTIDGFISGFEEGSLGAPPGLFSAAAYEATWVALDLVASKYGIESSLSNAYQFDESERRVNVPIYLYQWVGGERKLIEVFR